MKINYLSEFKIKENSKFIDEQTPFIFSYYTAGSSPYVASWDGVEYTNCHRDDDGSLVVVFENHSLGCGQLFVRREFMLADSDFSDGVCNISSTEKSLIELTTMESSVLEVETNVLPNYKSGLSAYEVALKNGFVGSEEEWLASLCGANNIVEGFDSVNSQMQPNILYIHADEPSEVVVTFAEGEGSAVTQEYMLIFTTSSQVPTFSYPSGVKWIGCVDDDGEPEFDANTTYEVNIVGDRGVIAGW